MDPSILQIIQPCGALGILALMVYKAPAIIQVISDLVQKVILNIRETQNQALAVFQAEQKSLVEMVERRLQTIDGTLVRLVETLTTLVTQVTSLDSRVQTLERDKSVDTRLENLERDKPK